MKVTVNMLKGTFVLTGDVSELARLAQAVEEFVPEPESGQVYTYYVSEYTQVYVVDEKVHGCFWVCSCDDFRYRRQSAVGEPAWLNEPCKHIAPARREHEALNEARRLNWN